LLPAGVIAEWSTLKNAAFARRTPTPDLQRKLMNDKFINQLVIFRPYLLDSAIIVWLSLEAVY